MGTGFRFGGANICGRAWECLLDRDLLEDLFRTAVAAADPARAIAAHLPEKPRGRTIVVGAGKASAQMAHAFEQLWGQPVDGLVVTRYGHAAPTSASIASGAKPFSGFWYFSASSLRKCVASSGMSSRRSARLGSSIPTTLSR